MPLPLYADRYQEIRELGSGVTGKVYLVKDVKTGFDCALKILHSPLEYVKPLEREGFRNEFQVLKDLNHPSIAKVFDAGLLEIGPFEEKSKHLYIVAEFIKGEDLFSFADGKSLEVVEDLFVQTLRALNYLHSKKVVHLDIKPTNMLVIEGITPPLKLRGGGGELHTPQLKLIDFGFANFYQRKSIHSDEGNLLTAGTAPYVSPEAIKLETLPDHRADLYSLGCAFYKILTRQVPFPGNSVTEIHNKHLHEKPRPPSSLLQSPIPDYWDKILLKLMEKDPANRYPSAQAVIEDLNLLSGKSYAIELLETRTSYLPQSGKMVARDREFEKFKEYYADRIDVQDRKKKPYLMIRGKSGVGKTRFLEECKNYAQAFFVKTMSWKEYKSHDMAEDIPQPCLVLADAVSFDADDIEAVDIFLSDLSILVIFATSREEISGDPDCTLSLKDFTKDQTAEYVQTATGLSQIPPPVLDIIYRHTHGNPLYLSEYLRALFEKGFLKDAQGSWSLQTLEDLGSELETSGATEFIKKRLRTKLNVGAGSPRLDIMGAEGAPLQDYHWNLLYTLALTGKPTLEDLAEMTMAKDIENNLKYLVDQEILEIDSGEHYSFSNALLKEVVLEKIPQKIKEEICDQAARYWESQKAPREKVLYYRGRGGSSEAPLCLLELSKIKREQQVYLSAKENLVELFQKENLESSLRNQTLLELGDLAMEMGKPEEAQTWLNQIPDSNNPQSGDFDPLIHVKMLELTGLSCRRRDMIAESDDYFRKGLAALQGIEGARWMEVILKNRLARNEFDKGNAQEAEKLFLSAWEIWKKELNEHEKIRSIRSDMDSVYFLKGDYEKAISFIEECLKILECHPSVEAYPIFLYKLGHIHIFRQNFAEGEIYLSKCLHLLKERKINYWLYIVYNEMGAACLKQEKWEEALSNLRHAFELGQRVSSRLHLFYVAYNMGYAYYQMKNYNEARKYFEFVRRNVANRSYEDKTTATTILFDAVLGLSSVLREQGNLQEAAVCLNEAEKIFSHHSFLNHLSTHLEEEKNILAKKLGR